MAPKANELEINIENWQLENDIPQFIIGNLQKKITNPLGLYEWRVKFDDFFALSAFSSISTKNGFHYNPIDYSGIAPNELSVDSWHYFPVNNLDQSIDNYTAFQCKDSTQSILIVDQEKSNLKSDLYNCKACNCRQS